MNWKEKLQSIGHGEAARLLERVETKGTAKVSDLRDWFDANYKYREESTPDQMDNAFGMCLSIMRTMRLGTLDGGGDTDRDAVVTWGGA